MYLKHKYSGRVYQICLDHGDEHPYLKSFPHVRMCGKRTMELYFSPCSGSQEKDGRVSVVEEIRWEKSQFLKKAPLRVIPPDPVKRIRKKGLKLGRSGYYLRDICLEVGMNPSKARKLLRSQGLKPPEGEWRWKSPKEAEEIKNLLRKFL